MPPPEQYQERARRGEFTDVYALAATTYALVTGQAPPPAYGRLMGNSLEIPKSLSPPVREAIQEGMRLIPGERPATIKVWLELLGAVGIAPPPLQPPPARSQTSDRYRPLEQMLAAGDWKAADEETLRVMLEVAGRQEEGWLERENIQQFPCEDLWAIDKLWVRHSNGKFGFSVQKQVYMACGAQLDGGYPGKAIWEKFGDKVGWRVGDTWIDDYGDITFAASAPRGHLPLDPWFRLRVLVMGQRRGLFSPLAQRLTECSRLGISGTQNSFLS